MRIGHDGFAILALREQLASFGVEVRESCAGAEQFSHSGGVILHDDGATDAADDGDHYDGDDDAIDAEFEVKN
jgi:hypothetical protein